MNTQTTPPKMFAVRNAGMMEMAKRQKPSCTCTAIVVIEYSDGRYYFHSVTCKSLGGSTSRLEAFIWSARAGLQNPGIFCQ